MRNLFELSEKYREKYYGTETQRGQKGLIYAYELTRFLAEAERHGEAENEIVLMMRLLEAGVMIGAELKEEENIKDGDLLQSYPGLDPERDEFYERGFFKLIEKNRKEIDKELTLDELQALGKVAASGKIYTALIDAVAYGYALSKDMELAEEVKALMED